ncbi:hypothetical protein LP420_07155 [Massilia sp. B-10]|nr:hypothetical protein LP420_07155 [Massilia sp. B-10]
MLDGTAENEWKIPATARQGTYRVMIGQTVAGSFHVEQFRVPTMRALLAGPKAAVVGEAKVDLDLQLSYLSGGGAAFAPVKVRTVVQPRGVSFSGYEGFQLHHRRREGRRRKGGRLQRMGRRMLRRGGRRRPGCRCAGAPAPGHAGQGGRARVALDPVAASEHPRDLVAEMSYADANGETMTASTRIPLWPSRYVIGINPDEWVMSKDAQVPGRGAGRERQPGPAPRCRSTSSSVLITRTHAACWAASTPTKMAAKSNGAAWPARARPTPRACCSATSSLPTDGNLILRAKAVDDGGRPAVSHHDVWVVSSGDWWFTASDNDRIDLLPGKKLYAPGEQATFQVRSPFREATALVTVEREGILETYIHQLSGKTPTFSIPVKGSYAPNVYVSALVVRGRVA